MSSSPPDNETVQVIVDPAGAIENQRNRHDATITVRLGTPPTQPVRIDVVNPDATEWVLDRTFLEFPAGGTAAQTLVVTGVDDDEIDGDITGTIVLRPIVSDDPVYQGLDPADVPALNRDDDRPLDVAWVIDPVDVQTSEAGDTGLLRIAFDRMPNADVRVGIESSDPSEIVVDPLELVFSPTDATTPQAVVLRGLDDDVVDGTRDVGITIRVISSADPQFAALSPQNIMASNLDDDGRSITLR